MPFREQVLEELRQSCAADALSVTECSLFCEIGLDSLSFVELIVKLEDKYGIRFKDEELNVYDWNSVKGFIDTVENYVLNKV